MFGYYFTTEQVNEIEDIYSKLVLSTNYYDALTLSTKLSQKITSLTLQNRPVDNDEEHRKCHKDDAKFHESRGS